MGFCALGLGLTKKNNRKMGKGFQFEQHRPGLWDLSWDLEKTISWEMGSGPPLHISIFTHCEGRVLDTVCQHSREFNAYQYRIY